MLNNSKIKVLIVDDEKGIRVGTKRLLDMEGYDVKTAENGTEGINSGTREEFDIAIIDLKMPDIDGIQVLKEIKKVYPDTICFIATAFASYETAIESARVGAHSYIPKPFTPEELLQHLHQGYEKRLLLIEAERLRKEREDSLLEVAFEKTRLKTIINSIIDGVLVINKKGETILWNPGLLKYIDMNEPKIGEKIIEKLHPGLASLINEQLENAEFEERSYYKEIELKPDKALFVEAAISPIPGPDGLLAGVVIILRNITEFKRIEQLKSQFVSMVSHELKAPVAAVHGFLKLIIDESIKITEEQKKDFINRSLFRLDSLLKMVNDLLDISRMEMQTINREVKPLDLKEVINNVLETFQLELSGKNISVTINTDDEIPPFRADYDEMSRLITNLISNGIKYNRHDGAINISLNYSEGSFLLQVKDTGIGLKPEEKKKLFTEFFRANNEFTKKISGTGLGLSIVKRIVDSYAGKIEVDSEFNAGTTFHIRFPQQSLN